MQASQLIVIPDGPLHALPFEALVLSGEDADPTYWIDEAPLLRYVASATVLYALTHRRAPAAASGMNVLSLSDPVYNASEVDEVEFAEAHQRSEYVRRGGKMARLPHTARETEAIVRAYGANAESNVQVLQRSAASEAAVRAHLPGKRYVHLATHGLADPSTRGNQGVYASLALTPPPMDAAADTNDGFLELSEIYQLSDAMAQIELVVLSACQTNIGPRLNGEGMLALSRGFLLSGARRVIASQWSVDDASTGVLIGTLFEDVLRDEIGGNAIRYAQALRNAQKRVKDDPENAWTDPHYWAGFVLIGTP